MSLINKRGILGIKWIYIIALIAAYIFRDKLIPLWQKLMSSMAVAVKTPSTQIVTTDTTNVSSN